MEIGIGWIIVIVVLVFGIIISNITLLKKSNKGFDFPDSYEKPKKGSSNKHDDEDEPSSLL